ncbi:MAG: M48 family metalloprotease [Bacteroidota bacterium]
MSVLALRAALYRTTLVLALLAVVGCASSTNFITGESQPAAYTWAEEVQIGQEADGQIIAQYGVYDNPELSAYVTRLGEAVLAQSALRQPPAPPEVQNTPFTFRVLDSPVVNAFALPGGFVYVTRGLLAHMDNEAQLAMVLGHEVGHVAGRHASRRAATQQRSIIGLIAGAAAAEVLFGGGAQVLDIGGTGVQLLTLSYGRDDERESDRAGVAYAERAGWDAAEGAYFFTSLKRLQAQAGASIPNFLSTHPDPGEREVTIRQLAAEYPTGTVINQAELFRMIDGIVMGNDPRQGFTEGGAFYHPELRFQFTYPTSWQVANGAAAVQIGEPNGAAAMIFTFAEGATPQAAGQALAGQEGFTAREQGAVTVNGLSAYRVVGTAASQEGNLDVVSYHIELGGTVYHFYGLAGSNAFSQFSGAMENALRSFARLTDSRYLNREPIRLDIVNAARTAPFSTLAQGRPMPDGMDILSLAILNQVDVNETIQAGTPLKLPR